ncbi:RNA-directed DNA polymerase, eukaryota [Tanacetum coccineum]
MESLHLSVSRAIEAGIFKGIKIDSTLNLSHLFYADDVVFIGEWSPSNLSGITNILHCFSLLSGLSINLKKSNLLGVGVRSEYVKDAAVNLGCLTMKTPFKYLGVMVGGICATSQAWEDTIGKLKARLSNWKLKTLSVGGRLTLLKSVLGSTPIYNLSIYKAPKSVLHSMESLRRNFFNGSQCNERKIAWIKWTTTLASKKNGGLGISSLYALNRALLFKWVWRFISRDNSLWCRLILSMHGSKLPSSSPFRYSTWLSIIREIHSLKDRGVDLVSHCRIHVGNGLRTNFWKEVWIGDNPLCVLFPRIFALETNKDSSVAVKLSSVTSSLRRPVRGGSESSQLSLLQEYIEGTILSSLEDRWVWDLNGEGVFCVKDVRNLLDDVFLPKAPIATRWIKYVPIKLNVFAWKVHLNRLPTRVNLQHRGVLVSDPSCPICHSEDEDLAHLFFRCSLVTDIVRLVCRWWNIAWASIDSYSNWLHWFNAIRLSPKVKDLLEGVFYITWWSIWRFRNQVLFSSLVPRKDVLFDDITKNTGKQPVVNLDEGDDDDMATRRVITRWNRNEEILLPETLIEHSQDANIRKDQQDDVYWNLIMEDFNSRTTAPPRTKNMMTGKLTRMHGDCQRFNAIYKHLTHKSGESDADLVENAKTSYIERCGKKILYDHVWNILKNYPKWNATEPIDEDNPQELFGPDPRERPAGKQRAPKKQKSVDTRKCDAAERAYEAKREKELAMTQCRELKFLMLDPSSLPPAKRAIIEKKQAEIMRKYPDA